MFNVMSRDMQQKLNLVETCYHFYIVLAFLHHRFGKLLPFLSACLDDLMSLLDAGAPGDHSAVLMDAAEALMTDDLLSYHRVTGRQSQAASSNSASALDRLGMLAGISCLHPSLFTSCVSSAWMDQSRYFILTPAMRSLRLVTIINTYLQCSQPPANIQVCSKSLIL